MFSLPAVGLAAALVATGPAQAAEVVFTDRAAFDAAAGPLTVIDFDEVDTSPEQFAYFETLTLSGVTFTSKAGEAYVMSPFYFQGIPYPDANTLMMFYAEPDIIEISFAPTRSFGFDFQHLSPPDRNPTGPFRIALSNGATFEAASPYSFALLEPMSFFGVISDTPFSSVTLSMPDFGAYNVTDNVRVGAAVVPEPGAWGLMILGFAACGGVLRRRYQIQIPAVYPV